MKRTQFSHPHQASWWELREKSLEINHTWSLDIGLLVTSLMKGTRIMWWF